MNHVRTLQVAMPQRKLRRQFGMCAVGRNFRPEIPAFGVFRGRRSCLICAMGRDSPGRIVTCTGTLQGTHRLMSKQEEGMNASWEATNEGK